MENAGLIEMALVFSVAVGLCVWELWSLRRHKRRAQRDDGTPR